MGLFNALGFLYPAAIYLLAIPPVLLLAYLARERPRQAIVSSAIAFRALHAIRGERFGARPRVNWTFFVELLVLCLAVLAIAAPYLSRSGNPIAVVIDNSAPMQAHTASGQTRFERVLARLQQSLDARGAGQVVLYVTAPQPYRLGTFVTAHSAEAAMARIATTDSPDDTAALTSLFAELNADRRLERILFGSYRPIAPPVPPRVTAITEAEPVANYAIGNFALDRENFGSAALHARLTVANFSPSAQTLTVTITADGKPAGRAQAKLQPGAVTPMDFQALAPAQLYEARLEPDDGFPLDNLAYATGSAVRGVSILFVSPQTSDGNNLRSIPGVTVATVAPGAYSPTILGTTDLAIFEFAVPKELPSVNTLLVLPPQKDPVFNFTTRPAAHLELTDWPPVDPLTDGVNFRLLNVRSGQYFGPHPWMHEVIGGAQGALLLEGSSQGHRFVASGFNPFPYLGRSNLPMSILTLNLLGYLAGAPTQTASLRAGEPWNVPAGITQIVLPSGTKQSVYGGESFSATKRGIYRLIGADGHTILRAVNLADLTTSDLERVAPLKIQSNSAEVAAAQSFVKIALMPYVLLAIMALVVLESLLIYRRRPGSVMPASRVLQ